MIDLSSLDNLDTSLREYQNKSKSEIYKAWNNSSSVLFQMPTGTGKTRLFVSIIKDIQRVSSVQKKRIGVLVLAHREELIEQIDQTLSLKYGIAHGIIKAGYEEDDRFPVQVASVQSLNRRLEHWKKKSFDYIIIDEAHHAIASTYQTICKAFPKANILGVTATPCRLGGDSLRSIFGTLILSQSVSKFINEGYLSDYKYYSIKPESSIQRELDNISEFSIEGDYSDRAMMKICDTPKIRAGILDAYIKYANGKKGIIYTINQKHNQNICEDFQQKGYKIKSIDSKTKASERKQIVSDFKAGKVDIICNVNIFSEGFDCPDIEFILLARPTCSLSLYLQQVGRGLRPHENKTEAIIIDNVGSYNKFGLPSANRKWRYHFEGYGQKVTKSTHRISIGGSRKKQNLEEGDEDLMLIYEGMEKSLSIDEDIKLINALIETSSPYPLGGLSLINKHHDYEHSEEFNELFPIYCKWSEQEWIDHITDESWQIEGIQEDAIRENIESRHKFKLNGKEGIVSCQWGKLHNSISSIKEHKIRLDEVIDILLYPVYDKIGVPDIHDMAICIKNGKKGVIDGGSMSTYVPFEYDDLFPCYYKSYICIRDNKVSFIGKGENLTSSPCDYIGYTHFSSDYGKIVLCKNGNSLKIFEYKISDRKLKELDRSNVRFKLHKKIQNDIIICDINDFEMGFCDHSSRLISPFVFQSFFRCNTPLGKAYCIINEHHFLYLDEHLNIIQVFRCDSEEATKWLTHNDLVGGIRSQHFRQNKRKSEQKPKEKPEVSSLNGINQDDNGKYGICKNGKYIIDPTYDSISHSKNGYFLTQRENLYGLISPDYKVIFNPKFDSIHWNGNTNEVTVSMNGYFGVNRITKINTVQTVIPVEYSKIVFNPGLPSTPYTITDNDQEFYYHKKHQGIITYKDDAHFIIKDQKQMTLYKGKVKYISTKWIKHIKGHLFTYMNEENLYGLITTKYNTSPFIRSCSYRKIEISEDKTSALLYKGDKRPRIFNLKEYI